MRRLNLVQRIVLVISLGAGLGVFGLWVTTPDSYSGWTGYAPLRSTAFYAGPGGGMDPWVQLLVLLGLIAIWALASLWLLRGPSRKKSESPPREG